MIRIFVMTPQRLSDMTAGEVNTYIRKAAEVMNTILKEQVEEGEELEFVNNFFVMTNDKGAETIRNSYDDISYLADELKLMEDADILVLPLDSEDAVKMSSKSHGMLTVLAKRGAFEVGARQIVELPFDYHCDI